MIDVLQIPDVLDAAACATLRAELRQLTGSARPCWESTGTAR